jgi:hypothetical protein
MSEGRRKRDLRKKLKCEGKEKDKRNVQTFDAHWKMLLYFKKEQRPKQRQQNERVCMISDYNKLKVFYDAHGARRGPYFVPA